MTLLLERFAGLAAVVAVGRRSVSRRGGRLEERPFGEVGDVQLGFGRGGGCGRAAATPAVLLLNRFDISAYFRSCI